MFHVPRGSRRRGFQKCLDHFAAREERDARAAIELRHNRPDLRSRVLKCRPQVSSAAAVAGGRSTRVIMAASRPRFRTSRKPDPQRTELTQFGRRIPTSEPRLHRPPAASGLVISRNYNDLIGKRLRARIAAETKVSLETGIPVQQEARAAGLCPNPCVWTHPPPVSLRTSLAPGSCTGR